MFTRRSEADGQINTLWAAKVDEGAATEIDLLVANVVHFAEWGPDSRSFAYSTVEPRSSAPGWQANNDLDIRTFNPFSGFVSFPNVVLDTNSGGTYGWWGTSFAWSPDGENLAFANPDGLGWVKVEEEATSFLLRMAPLQTGSEWAWVPGARWGPDGNVLYGVEHIVSEGVDSPDTSPDFDLVAIPLTGGAPLRLVSQVGMFAYPSPSPLQAQPTGGSDYQVAYLQAITPLQSDTSLYRLVIMDRDGSNRREMFPAKDERGLKPQRVIWSPAPVNDQGDYAVLVVHQGNLWLVNATTGDKVQITADGLTIRADWK
jgi:hypothetical protein